MIGDPRASPALAPKPGPPSPWLTPADVKELNRLWRLTRALHLALPSNAMVETLAGAFWVSGTGAGDGRTGGLMIRAQAGTAALYWPLALADGPAFIDLSLLRVTLLGLYKGKRKGYRRRVALLTEKAKRRARKGKVTP